MNLRSIRWRLPLSYAAIALVAALALGVVLLTVLRGYYSQQELVYLHGNSLEIGATMAKMLQGQMPREAIQSQVDLYSLLTQVKIRVLDARGSLIAESNLPDRYQVVSVLKARAEGPVGIKPGPTSAPGPLLQSKPTPAPGPKATEAKPSSLSEQELQDLKQKLEGQTAIYITLVAQPPEGGQAASVSVANPNTMRLPDGYTIDDSQPNILAVIPAAGTKLGAAVAGQAPIFGRRSSQSVHTTIMGNGQKIGDVVLSDGPAYGVQILDSVTQAWVVASAFAVLLAAAVGYWISRTMSHPLTALTAVTTRMAEGDLAARANVAPRDEIGQLACAYNQMAEQIETTITALRRFVADAAHELHTPLTALRTNLELAGGEEQAEAQREFLRRAQEQVDRLDKLSSSLLDLSRLEAQAEAVEMAPLDLAALATTVSEPYASRAEQSGLSLTLDVPPEPVTVRGNSTQLAGALGNLLDNAIKFAAPASQITLRLTREKGWASLAVEDTGLGIPAEDLAQLGTRFHRGRNAAGYPGSGLGLAIVRAIAERHGGELRAEDTGQGARFTLRVPVA